MAKKMEVVGNIYCAGVYGMRCKDSKDYLYIGTALEINDAKSRHEWHLRRELYDNNNKAILQKNYDNLTFEVIHESESADVVKNMTKEQRASLNKALGVLEEFFMNLYKDTICNKQTTVKRHSSNKNSCSTYKRKIANKGNKNPNSKYNEQIIAEILWLKINGYKPKDIEKMYESIGIKSNYIYTIGIYKWIHLEPIKPDWVA